MLTALISNRAPNIHNTCLVRRSLKPREAQGETYHIQPMWISRLQHILALRSTHQLALFPVECRLPSAIDYHNLIVNVIDQKVYGFQTIKSNLRNECSASHSAIIHSLLDQIKIQQKKEEEKRKLRCPHAKRQPQKKRSQPHLLHLRFHSTSTWTSFCTIYL